MKQKDLFDSLEKLGVSVEDGSFMEGNVCFGFIAEKKVRLYDQGVMYNPVKLEWITEVRKNEDGKLWLLYDLPYASRFEHEEVSPKGDLIYDDSYTKSIVSKVIRVRGRILPENSKKH